MQHAACNVEAPYFELVLRCIANLLEWAGSMSSYPVTAR